MFVSNRKALAVRPNLKAGIILAVLALLVLSRGLPVGNVHADTPIAASDTHCEDAARQAYDSIDLSTANQNALSSSVYSQSIVGYHNPTFSSIFQIGSLTSSYPSGTFEAQSYNVVYILHDSTGIITGDLVITESSPNLEVIGSSIQTHVFYANTNMITWAGQQAAGNSGATATITEVQATWYQPTISPASGGCG